MIKLILDTSHSYIAIGLSHNEHLTDCVAYPHNNKLSGLLTLSIQSLLKKHALSPDQISAICVGIGPGSYTGTRTAVSVAKGLSLGLRIPLIPFCSALAYIPQATEGDLMFIMPTKQNNPFLISLKACKETYHQITCHTPATSDIPLSELADKLILTHNIETLIKAHPMFSQYRITPSSISLEKLCSHLHNLYMEQNFTPHTHLETIELLYLNPMSVPLLAVESLRS
ncbi:MAG: tRNA (adenosine(37)-N6)-threonylcarbamoyltransferase complex dimerization subunit type 1 TsaB [Chlamydiae bacterium]|nr:tRNA (adenosine(37)-N6)-threonylcarbamoyltransferase complex dimerization subunit type 1 TsaB [Chlamydiota bacterium]